MVASSTTTKEFWLRSRFIRASARRIDDRRHVFVLTVQDGTLLSWFKYWVPAPARSWLQLILPEWFLPSTVILKERNAAKPKCHENEVKMYRLLKALQGDYIPHLFGEVTIDKEPAIVMEYIDGQVLNQLPSNALQATLGLLETLYRKFEANNVVHNDPKLCNFLFVDKAGQKRVVAIDLEFALFRPVHERVEHDLRTMEDLIHEANPRSNSKEYVQDRSEATKALENLSRIMALPSQ